MGTPRFLFFQISAQKIFYFIFREKNLFSSFGENAFYIRVFGIFNQIMKQQPTFLINISIF